MSSKKFKLDIVFYVNGLPFDGNTTKERSLGGSETAGLMMAKEMAKLGHYVTVFSNCDKPGVFDKVRYMPLGKNSANYFQYIATENVDVNIVERAPNVFSVPNNAKLNILWGHDVMLKRFGGELYSGLWNIDKAFILSDFHKKQWQQVFGLPDELFFKTRNGVEVVPLDTKLKRAKKRLFYSGRPERGLVYLAEIMPLVWELDPEIEFHYATYAFPGKIQLPNGQQVDEDSFLINVFRELQKIGGKDKVKMLGKLPKQKLYEEMQQASLYTYPAEFEEISCISAMEAMMCGLPILANKRGALPETIVSRAGILIGEGTDGEVNTPQFKKKFSQQIVDLINDQDKLKLMSEAGREHAEKNLGWDQVAVAWEKQFYEMFADKTSNKQRLAKHLFDLEDIQALRVLNLPEWNEKIKKHYDCVLGTKESYEAAYEKEATDYTTNHVSKLFKSLDENPELFGQFVASIKEIGRMKLLFDVLKRKNAEKPFVHLLDYGCAEGQNAMTMGLEFPEMAITVVDAAQHNLAAAEYLLKKSGVDNEKRKVNCVHASSPKELPDKGGYDVVFVGEVLEHIADPTKFINELESKVKDGTLIIFTTPLGKWKTNTLDLETMGLMGHVWHFEKSDLLDLFENKADLEIYSVSAGAHNRGDSNLGWHLVQYRKDATKKTGVVNIERKLAIQAPRETVSVCMLTENSENLLHRTLKSVKHIANEIIICDSGSTDSTVEICKQYTDKIYSTPSPREIGFDAARNFGISKATSDWILWIDSDEELLTPFNITKYLRNNMFNGYAIKQHHFSAQPPNAFEADLPVRLFRNRKGIKFLGIIHEHPEIDINKSVGHTHLILDADIAHDGYLTESGRKEKYARNFPLLLKDREINPERVLGKFLFIRDMVHLARYKLELTKGVLNEEIIGYLETAVKLFQETFLGGSALLRNDGIKYYSEALLLLNKGIDITFLMELPGFTKKISQPTTLRFASQEDFMKFYSHIVTSKIEGVTGKYL